MVENYGQDVRSVSVGAVPLLKLFGIVAGGWQLMRSALISSGRLESGGADGPDSGFHRAKIATARFYGDHVLPQTSGLAQCVIHGSASALAEDLL